VDGWLVNARHLLRCQVLGFLDLEFQAEKSEREVYSCLLVLEFSRLR